MCIKDRRGKLCTDAKTKTDRGRREDGRRQGYYGEYTKTQFHGSRIREDYEHKGGSRSDIMLPDVIKWQFSVRESRCLKRKFKDVRIQ